MDEKLMEQEVVKLLMALGIRNNGYLFYKKMILGLLKSDNKFFNITERYLEIAVECRTTYTKVEHAMRASIYRVTKSKLINILNTYYGIDVIFQQPSISGFIRLLVEYLREFKNCKLIIR